jgi:hypothetical protein
MTLTAAKKREVPTLQSPTLSHKYEENIIKLFVPYDMTGGAGEWGNEGVTVDVNLVSLLQLVLPVGCFTQDSTCCAVTFVREAEQADVTKQARTALKLPAAEEEKLKESNYCSWEDIGCECSSDVQPQSSAYI